MTSGADQATPRPAGDPLESLIAAAGGYVHPSDDLRPRVLEAARERSRRRRGQRRLLAIAGGISGVLILMTSAWLGFGSVGPSLTPVAATDLHHQALVVATRTGVDPAWGLYEAVVELRHDQATRINASCDASSGSGSSGNAANP